VDRFLVVSSDGHAGPPANQYREYLEDRYKPMFDEHQQKMREQIEVLRGSGLRGDNRDFVRRWEKLTGGDGGLLAGYDSDHRNNVLNKEGIAAEVLFPDADVLGTGRVSASPFGSGLGGGRGYEPDVAMAGARAHNRWLADFVAKSPERRVGLAVAPLLHDIDVAVTEIREAKTLGLRGVLIPTRWYDYPAYNDPRYEPIWEVCEELDMPVHTHAGAGPTDYEPGSPGYIGLIASEAGWWGYRPLHVLLWAGVFDRHPGLKFIPTELGNYWAEDLFRKMDEKWYGGHNTAKFADDNPFRKCVKEPPSAYLGRNVFLGASTPGQEDMDRRGGRINEAIMWGSDLPHPEGTFPFTRYWIRTRYHDVPEDQTRKLLGSNAARCYNIDTAALESLVEEIGVTEDDIYGDSEMEAAPF
jgi:predicted TIM-barrel fold metal-dependent hydrolase